LFCLSAFFAFFGAWAVSSTNPRGDVTKVADVRESDVGLMSRRSGESERARTLATRMVASNARSGTNQNLRNSFPRVGTRGAVLSRVASQGVGASARAGKTVSNSISGVARSSVARATAVFNDVSKIGSGYAACRESYATCMDQICANANDTYRRCFCSDRFSKFREIEDRLDQAMILLQSFQDNNLNAVDKTAAEVNAMYSATVGEMAIKKDTSAAANALDQIGKMLSGASSTTGAITNSSSLGILDLDFSFDDWDNIWDKGTDSIFGSGNQDISSLEGKALFDASQRQCVNLSRDNCASDAVFSMARSSYNVLITQDCNTYEKSLNKKRETVAAAVRTAEKYLREARLEEYRSHNSADVNECLDRVRTSILADTACGAGYKRCLDPTGAYINGATGDAIYSPRLFELEKTISLDGVTSGGMVTDVLAANSAYDRFLDGYRKYVTRDLDTCRDIADFVWTEFKRNAIIEIAQSQTAKIEEVKSSCVDTMAECYDSTNQQLINFDTNTATTAAVLGRYAAKNMCNEKVVTCAALFGGQNAEGCKFDSRGHLLTDGARCGLESLLNYVDAVNSINVVQKCEAGLRDYFVKLCTPENGVYSYPYNCRNMRRGGNNTTDITYIAQEYAVKYCQDPTDKQTQYESIDAPIKTVVDSLVDELEYDISSSLKSICESLYGYWHAFSASPLSSLEEPRPLTRFYNNVYGGDQTKTEWGICYENSDRLMCLALSEETDDYGNILATWNNTLGKCQLSDEWYRMRCEDWLDGYYQNSMCYVKQ
jgi:hypothetical protein